MALAVAAVNTLVYGRPMTDRLTRSDWIRHGLATLAKDGANALKVGPMADGLKVSRGSFYWHFRDIADFRAQLLQAWQEQATDRVIEELEARKDRPDRRKQFMRRAFTDSRRVCNVHWASDVEEGRVIGSAVVARLHDNADFKADLAAARSELAALRAKGAAPSRDCAQEAARLAAG